MRVVFFAAGGSMGSYPLQALAQTHDIVAVVRPRFPSKQWFRHPVLAARNRRNDVVYRVTRQLGAPTLSARSGRDEKLRRRLRRLSPDLICISSFPWILDSILLEVASAGVLNVHGSLLPRHRGPEPYFWTYYHNDLTTGVTVHMATREADAGPILAQTSWPLPRGMNIVPLHNRMAREGATLLCDAVKQLAAGNPEVVPQEERRATSAPMPNRTHPMVNFAEWDVERVWHFLAGIYPYFREPLTCHGKVVRYQSVPGFHRTEAAAAPGTIDESDEGWRLSCRGGFVRLSPRRRGTVADEEGRTRA